MAAAVNNTDDDISSLDLQPGEEMMIMSEAGVVVRTGVGGVSKQGRATQGVHVMRVADNDKVTAVAITKTKAKREGARSDDPREDLDDEGAE